MAQQFLDSTDVIACFKQMGGKAVAQRVGRDRLAQAGLLCCLADELSNHAFMQVEAIERAILLLRIFGELCRGKDELPTPFLSALGYFNANA